METMPEEFKKSYRPELWSEIVGQVAYVQEREGLTYAQIGKITVVLPIEMADQLRKSQGKYVGILRTDKDFRIRTIPETANENCGETSCGSVIIFDRNGIRQSWRKDHAF